MFYFEVELCPVQISTIPLQYRCLSFTCLISSCEALSLKKSSPGSEKARLSSCTLELRGLFVLFIAYFCDSSTLPVMNVSLSTSHQGRSLLLRSHQTAQFIYSTSQSLAPSTISHIASYTGTSTPSKRYKHQSFQKQDNSIPQTTLPTQSIPKRTSLSNHESFCHRRGPSHLRYCKCLHRRSDSLHSRSK